MIVQAVDPASGKKMTVECIASSESDIRDLLEFDLSEEGLKRRIDGLDVSADAKSILFTIAKTTIRVGSVVVKIGRKILDVVAHTLAEFPMTGIGVILGAVFGYLVATIPVVGFLMGGFVAPLAIAFGFVTGAIQDFSNKALERRLMASMASFDGLKSKS